MADNDSRRGLVYYDRNLLEYVARLHLPPDAGRDAAAKTPETSGLPSIQVGPSEGRLLGLLLRMIGARTVLEIGTLAGYSAISMARELPEDGQLFTLESNPRHAFYARTNIARAGLAKRVTVLEGNAMDMLATVEEHGPFCAVFIDADKGNYHHYGRFAARVLRKGGLLLGDNAFLFGRLLDDSEEAMAMRAFHEEAREWFDTVCIPTPDGLLLGVRR